jgi:type I restriction enzyme S subunit
LAAILNEKISRIDALTAETERFIELARERRTALITAAVTGQVDLREAA